MKLSEAQKRLLRDVGKQYRNRCASSYPPAHKLRELGLVDVEEQRYGGWRLSITPAGLKALEEE